MGPTKEGSFSSMTSYSSNAMVVLNWRNIDAMADAMGGSYDSATPKNAPTGGLLIMGSISTGPAFAFVDSVKSGESLAMPTTGSRI